MQISKAFLFLCPALLCAASLTLNAADNPDQIKAREALEKALQTQPATTAPAAVPQAPKAAEPAPAPKPAPEPAKAVPAATVAVQPVVVLEMPTPADPAAIEKAREALRQKMNELNAGAQPGSLVVAASDGWTLVVPASGDSATIEKAREALRQKMAELNGGGQAGAMVVGTSGDWGSTLPPSSDPAAIEKAREAMDWQMSQLGLPAKSPATPKGMPAFEPLPAPPAAVSAEKQMQLSTLLGKYKADKITPDEYHAERARILAQ